MNNNIEKDNVKFKEETGARLRAVRKLLKMSQDAAASDSGVSKNFISVCERGLRKPSLKYLFYLHDRHNVDINYILGSETRPFRLPEDERVPDLDGFREIVDVIKAMVKVPLLRFAVLNFLCDYQATQQQKIDAYLRDKGLPPMEYEVI